MDLLHAAGIPVNVVDARDYHLLSQALNSIQPQILVHLAAIAHANQSNKDPHSTFDTVCAHLRTLLITPVASMSSNSSICLLA